MIQNTRWSLVLTLLFTSRVQCLTEISNQRPFFSALVLLLPVNLENHTLPSMLSSLKRAISTWTHSLGPLGRFVLAINCNHTLTKNRSLPRSSQLYQLMTWMICKNLVHLWPQDWPTPRNVKPLSVIWWHYLRLIVDRPGSQSYDSYGFGGARTLGLP